MGVRRSACSVCLVLVTCLGACAHEPATRIEVPYQYPQAGAKCDNQRLISTSEVQLLVPHIRESHLAKAEGDKVQNWTAALAMISTYLGKPMAPCQVATSNMGGLSCCRKPGFAYQSSCERPAWPLEIERALTDLDLHSVHLERPLSEREMRQELSNGRPLLLITDTITQHPPKGPPILSRRALVVSGYAGDKYHVLDPDTEGGTFFMTYGGLIKGPAPWRESWYLISFRRDGCNPRFHGDCDCLH